MYHGTRDGVRDGCKKILSIKRGRWEGVGIEIKKKKTKGGEWESGGRKEERGKRDRENRRAD